MKCLALFGVAGVVWALSSEIALAQDYSVLRINEVIASNNDQPPSDVGGGHVDMVELYNSGSEPLTLGAAGDNDSLVLTDTATLPFDPAPWRFPSGTTIQPGKFVIVFCDGDAASQGTCELHTSFSLANDGTEPVTLWGPVTAVVDGRPVRQILDQVWLPPLPANVSFGRFPDGAGPAPVPLGEVLSTFEFYPPGASTFGSACAELPSPCAGNTLKKKFCTGLSNPGPGGNLSPHVNLFSHSTNQPAAGEPVRLRVKVDDPQGATPPNIALVEAVYRVNGGSEQRAAFTYDAGAGVQQGVITDCDGPLPGTSSCPNPFDLWTYWDGQIPGQAAGSTVEFYLRVVDTGELEDTSPDVLCPDGIGPCDRDFGGPGCPGDPTSESCNPVITGAKFVACRKPFSYRVGYSPRAEVSALVINEVVASQDGLLKDNTEHPCDPETDACPVTKPECCKFREDFLELYNSSPSSTIDLSGLWLSDGPFNPEVWQFPAGSKILPLEHLIIWLDRDGGKCPIPAEPNKPCFWECPDPTNPATQEYHTNFALDAGGDEVYLFDTSANGFGVIHGVELTRQTLNHSLALLPDGSRGGCWIDSDAPTPRDPNTGSCPGANFLRSDANANCAVDLSDAVYTLGFLFNGGTAPPCPDSADSDDSGKIDISDAIFTLGYLFLGGRAPPAPGPDVHGADPTSDELGDCNAPSC